MSTVPMIAPDGTPGDVPQQRVGDAVKAGFKVAAELKAPTGQIGLVPLHRVHDAINAGFMLQGASPSAPGPPRLSPSEEMPLAQAQEDAKGNTGQTLRRTGSPAAAGLALGGGGALLGPGLASGGMAAGPGLARALTPIAQRYGIKALEGAGLAYGWHLYRELKNVFEGDQ